MVVALLDLFLSSHPLPEHRAAIVILVSFNAPVVVEFLALLGILRRRIRPR
jgi:hypothetical protein